MTYKDRFAQALKLKDFVSLHDDKAEIFLVFTSDTDFQVKVFGPETDDHTKNQIYHEFRYAKKLPIAFICWSEVEEAKVYSYYDPNFYVHIDFNSGDLMYFESSDCDSLDLNVLRKDALASYSELITKLK